MKQIPLTLFLFLFAFTIHGQCSFVVPEMESLICYNNGTPTPYEFGPFAEPPGGLFTGPGIDSDGTFYPEFTGIPGPGPVSNSAEVTFTYTVDVGGVTCETMATVEVIVPIEVTIQPIEEVYCLDDPDIQLLVSSGFDASAGTFEIDGMPVMDDIFSPSLYDTGPHFITYDYLDENADCISRFSQVVYLYTDEELSNFIETSLNEIPDSISFTSNAFDLYPQAIGVSFSGNGVVQSGSSSLSDFDPFVAGVGNHTIYSSFSTSSGACSFIDSTTIEVYLSEPCVFDIPIVERYLCFYDSDILNYSQYAFPPGGTFSGPGISPEGIFTPTNTGLIPGEMGIEEELDFTYTVDVDGVICTATASVFLSVPIAVSILPIPTIYCEDDPEFQLLSSIDEDGSFGGYTINGNPPLVEDVFSPSFYGAGSYLVVYNFLDLEVSCFSRDTIRIEVYDEEQLNGLTTISLNEVPGLISVEAEPVELNPYPPGGVLSGPGIVDNTFDPALAGFGNHTIYFEFTTGSGACSTVDSLTFQVFSPGACSFDIPLALQYPCYFDSAPFDYSSYANPPGGTFSGPGMESNGIFYPSNTGVIPDTIGFEENIEFTYTVLINGEECSASENVSLSIPTMASILPTSTVYCDDDPEISLIDSFDGDPLLSTYTINGISILTENIFSPQSYGPGTYEIVFNLLDPDLACYYRDTLLIEVYTIEGLIDITSTSLQEIPGAILIDGEPITLNPQPPNGILSGTGIVDNTFDPVLAGLGIHTIYYNYTTEQGACTVEDSTTIHVQEPFLSNVEEIGSSEITVWPNPSNGRFSFAINESVIPCSDNGQLKLYNTRGMLSWQGRILSSTSSPIETGIKESGTFFWEYICGDQRIESGKLIIAP